MQHGNLYCFYFLGLSHVDQSLLCPLPSLSSYSREKKNDPVLWSQDVKFTTTVGSQTGRDAVDRERRWGKKMTQRRRKKRKSPDVTIGSEGGTGNAWNVLISSITPEPRVKALLRYTDHTPTHTSASFVGCLCVQAVFGDILILNIIGGDVSTHTALREAPQKKHSRQRFTQILTHTECVMQNINRALEIYRQRK